MKTAIVLAITLIALTSCGGLQLNHMRRASAGHVPCSPAEMNIRPGSTNGMGNQNWTVSCRGRTFYCNQMASGDIMNQHLSYSCTER